MEAALHVTHEAIVLFGSLGHLRKRAPWLLLAFFGGRCLSFSGRCELSPFLESPVRRGGLQTRMQIST